ncbi:ATP-grasp domain-containing protein [Aneurinibacillus thermoaerophilus]|uniref:ATP-grasp domain-containing protein n=1 Tax=Aneurinibacillus thermoaerophilus TaxID=143495 RepID=UPI002E220117|nr:ATP-grasp domain-containing protein [Aneurinibacillus thermoaerophilus]MED0678777.1 ATP-grasp domain-containing protein [Aneurinibacillus thermoaerophilus]MED0766246.1 ATP-grasp domain-containing protein [Aneurinibacillus thermoaerophilus]
MNIYAQILIDEAKSRGIDVEIVDEEANLYRLHYNGKSILCRESLTEKTCAMAITICDNKSLTHRMLKNKNLRVPRHTLYQDMEQAVTYMKEWNSIVVKPVSGEQGRGITVDVRTKKELQQAVENALRYSNHVLLEEFVEGKDLRMIVIDYTFVAAAERKPAFVIGNGKETIRQLIENKNRRLAEKTKDESQIPLNRETERVIQRQNLSLDDVLPDGMELQVCKTANYHTGGTITDTTAFVSPFLRKIAEEASRALNIPVVGLDLLVPDFTGEEYVIIEANERPGLANHEPQPTAQHFIDFLFPETKK